MPFLGTHADAPWRTAVEIEACLNEIIPEGGCVPFREFDAKLIEGLKLDKERENFNREWKSLHAYIQDLVNMTPAGVKRRVAAKWTR